MERKTWPIAKGFDRELRWKQGNLTFRVSRVRKWVAAEKTTA